MSDKSTSSSVNNPQEPVADRDLVELKLFVAEDLAKAWQRCSWIIVNDTGRERTEIMEEMVLDFLKKHKC